MGTIGMSATIGIGHLITAGTMMWIHAWRIGQLSRWLDTARDELEDEEVESEEQNDEVVEETTETIEEEEPELEIPTPVTEEDEIELVDLD